MRIHTLELSSFTNHKEHIHLINKKREVHIFTQVILSEVYWNGCNRGGSKTVATILSSNTFSHCKTILRIVDQ